MTKSVKLVPYLEKRGGWYTRLYLSILPGEKTPGR